MCREGKTTVLANICKIAFVPCGSWAEAVAEGRGGCLAWMRPFTPMLGTAGLVPPGLVPPAPVSPLGAMPSVGISGSRTAQRDWRLLVKRTLIPISFPRPR